MLLVSCAAAQTGTTTLQSVSTERDGENLRVEITLSAPTKPAHETAVHPDRILLDFPHTVNHAGTRNIAVNANGIRHVRIGQHTARPLVTRVVIDLDRPHVYSVTTVGNRIVVTIAQLENSRTARGAPVAATTGNLIGVFRKRHDPKPVSDTPADVPQTPGPPPAVAGPAFEPPAETPPATAAVPKQPAPQTSSAATSPDVAAKPDASTMQIAADANSGVSATAPTPASTSTSNALATEAAAEPASPKRVPAAPGRCLHRQQRRQHHPPQRKHRL